MLTPRDVQPSSTGPVAWWKFDETAGTTAANAAGKKLEGQIQGQPKWVQGCDSAGQALEFDGLKNWVECASSSTLDFRQGITLSAWFKVRAFDRPGQTLAAKGNAWRLERQADNGLLQFALSGPVTKKGRSPTVATKRAVDDGGWHQIIACYDGKRLALYLDGAEEDAVNASGAINLTALPVTLGENDASRGRLFSGWLDDVRLYARGLGPDEVKSLGRKAQQ